MGSAVIGRPPFARSCAARRGPRQEADPLALSQLLPAADRDSRNSVTFRIVSSLVARSHLMRRHDLNVVVFLTFLFLLSMAIGLYAWL
jgi:hypothetical protein